MMPIEAMLDDVEALRVEYPHWFEDLSGRLMIDRDGGDECEIYHHEFSFVCGPETKDRYLHDGLSCYDWMEKVLQPVAEKNGFELLVGDSENHHSIILPETVSIDDVVMKANEAFDLCLAALKAAMPNDVMLVDKSRIHSYHL